MGGKRRRRSRSRSRGSGVSRRSFLAGGLLTGVGGLLAAGSGAFTQVRADRSLRVGTTSDDEALVGLDVVPAVNAGQSDQDLVAVTNNADRSVTASVALVGQSDGAVRTGPTALGPGDTRWFRVDVADDATVGESAFPFEVSVTGEGIEATVRRATDVRALRWRYSDRSDNRARYSVYYEVAGVSDATFGRVEVTFRNVDDGSETVTETRYSQDGSVDYAATNGGTSGDSYTLSVRVFDSDGAELMSDSTSDVADGDGGGGDDLGGPDEPEFVRFGLVADESRNGKAGFRARYEVSVPDPDRFAEVRVEFDHASTNKQQNDRTRTTTERPTGEVAYPDEQSVSNGGRGGVYGDDFEVSATVYRPGSDGTLVPVDTVELPTPETADGTVDDGNRW